MTWRYCVFHDILSSRSFRRGLVFLALIVVGTQLYSWHVRRTNEAELERIKQTLQLHKNNNDGTTAPVTQPVTSEIPGAFVDTTHPDTDTPKAAETQTLPNDTETQHTADARLPDNSVSEQEPDEDANVSPYGFGPSPELPQGWPADKIWPSISADHELMTRVQVKLAHQGKDVRGAIMENGMVYPMIQGTLYIQWDETNGRRYIRRMTGPPETTDRIDAIREELGKRFTEADIPSDINVLSHEEGAIDPYTFLDLP